MSSKKTEINEVFTPRSHVVNPQMYIARPNLEKELKRAVIGTLHAILTGESGGGKTWLFKHVAQTENWKIFYANAGNGARLKSLSETIASAIFDEDDKELKEYTQTIEARAQVWGIGGGAETERKYEFKSKDILLTAFKAARDKGGNQNVVVVIDNLEAIYTKSELMEELGNIILLLDDQDYAKYKIKLLIVGVPSDVVEYYQKLAYLETVANRIQELPQVVGLNTYQIQDFVQRGFIKCLEFDLTKTQLFEMAAHIETVTLGIAQRLHEYCEILAYNIQDSGWKYDSGLLDISDHRFMIRCLKKSYAVVDCYMNDRRTKTGRRNQVIYALGKVKPTEFDVKEVEDVVRKEFPLSTDKTTLAVGQMLADLAKGEKPLLRKGTKSAFYRFADPRYLMCIRVMVKRTPGTDRIFKATFKR
jgi:hypothetical protein